MPKEIERKFTVHDVPENMSQFPHQMIDQGYLAITKKTEVRLRRVDDAYFQTVKTGGGLSRGEVEVALSQDQFEALWPLTADRRVTKVRYEISVGRWAVELDVFGGHLAGLVLAEVEFDTAREAAAFHPPSWFGIDVTEDARYRNQTLALKGKP